MIKEHSPTCHICGAQSLKILNGFSEFCQITSDCRPWRSGGKVAICSSCGSVQKVIDSEWQLNANEIYKSYAIYSQAGGEEQRVFDQSSGVAKSRSTCLVRNLIEDACLPSSGRLLDIGCGNGAFLRAFSDSVSGWQLAGLEVNNKHRSEIDSIPGTEALYVGQVEDTPGQFDAISMIHVLEHIPNPINFIRSIKDKLRPGGVLCIEVPDIKANPFDLLIADHSTHFTELSLRKVIEAAGFRVISAATTWIPKEISMLVCDASGKASGSVRKDSQEGFRDEFNVFKHLQWLQSFLERAKESEGGAFGIFGTSIVGAWLAAELGDKIGFFVDEDSTRHGGLFFGKPILHPDEVPDAATVYLGLTPTAANNVYARLSNSRFRLVLPPSYEIQ